MKSVKRLRNRIASYQVRPLGWVIIGVVAICALVVAFGPPTAQVIALIVGLLALLTIVSEGAGEARFGGPRFGGRFGGRGTESERRERLADDLSKKRDFDQATDTTPDAPSMPDPFGRE